MIIDFHSHLERDTRTRVYLLEELMADCEKNGISRRVVSVMQGGSVSAQNDEALTAANNHGERLIASAVIDPKRDDSLDEAMRVAGNGRFKVAEFDSREHGYLPESCVNIDDIIDVLQSKELVISVFTGWGSRTAPQQWGYYVKRHPKARFVFLHMGGIDFGYGCIEYVKQFDNVWLETSAMYEMPILRKAFSELPAEKFLFGSHYPHKFTECSIKTFELLKLSDSQTEKLFCLNASELLNL